MPSPTSILEEAYKISIKNTAKSFVKNKEISEWLEIVCLSPSNRACVRLLLSCLLAKVYNPKVDIRKPYTKIHGRGCFSGRSIDEKYITPFINNYNLPCNSTTAYLTPALRNRDIVLTKKVDLVGRPPEVYQSVLCLLDAVHIKKVSASDMLCETIRLLVIYRDSKKQRLESLLAELKTTQKSAQLPVKMILTIISQHLKCPDSSRLPVLVVAAAYHAAQDCLREKILPLTSHNAADSQTGSLGDLEVTLINDDNVITSYEMKDQRVTKDFIDRAVEKLAIVGKRIDNYIFIVTEPVDKEIVEYAESLYEKTYGIEFAILDCIGFLEHFLYLFYRLRTPYINAYQKILLDEPESSVRQELKEVFLALRKAAESANRF